MNKKGFIKSKDIKMIVDKKRYPTKDELIKHYVNDKTPLEHIARMYGYVASQPIKNLLKKYEIEQTHLNYDFVPDDKELFKKQLEELSVSKLVDIYKVPRERIEKYIKKENLDIGYFKNFDLSNDQLIEELKQDFGFNIAEKYNLSQAEIKRRLKVDGVNLVDIEIKDIKNKLIKLMETENQEGKRFTSEPRLKKYIYDNTKNHKLFGDKITERVYRIVNNYKNDDVDVCIICKKEVKFYTYKEGYGYRDNKLCRKCIPSFLGFNGASKMSQELFDTIYNTIENLNEFNTNYKMLNKEFVIDILPHERTEHTNKYYYSLDFVYKNKVIEFDGSRWHKDVEYEKAKDIFLKNRGYEILHIIDKDYIKNKEEEINKCIDFLEGDLYDRL